LKKGDVILAVEEAIITLSPSFTKEHIVLTIIEASNIVFFPLKREILPGASSLLPIAFPLL
jgi:hypothetical protein